MNTISGKLFLFAEGVQEGTLFLHNGCIEKIELHKLESELERSRFILPGLVDIHLHGAAGHDFCEGTKESMEAIEAYEKAHGVTSLVPTTMTLPTKRIERILSEMARYMETHGESILRGIHLEGPFLAKEKCGAQAPENLLEADAGLIRKWQELSKGLIKQVSLAPEVSGAMECIEECTKEVVMSLAHTNADYETALCAMQKGAMHVTHLYNAMPAYGHRAPGVVGAAADAGAMVEMICDGLHVHDSVIRNTFRMFGEDKVILISDSMMATGMPDGEYELGGQRVLVKGKRAQLENGALAGSVTNLYECMVHAIHAGVNPLVAVRASSYNPALSLGLHQKVGSLTEGRRGDVLVADTDWNLKKVYVGGEIFAEY